MIHGIIHPYYKKAGKKNACTHLFRTIYNIVHGAKKENGETIVPVIIALNEPDHSLLPYFNVDIKIPKKE